MSTSNPTSVAQALRAAWSRPWASGLLLYSALALTLLCLRWLPDAEHAPLATLERAAFDWKMQVLRQHWPRPLEADVVLVGIDEATEAAFPEPFALWHRRFAALLNALSAGGARAVGVDIVLPERSYDDIVPGSDLALMRALVQARPSMPLVFAQSIDRLGRAAPVHLPFERVLGETGLGLDRQLKDPDGLSRRFNEPELGSRQARTLAGQVLRRLDHPVQQGYIDYSVGKTLTHLPMHEVIAWAERGDTARLAQAFKGRVVMVGYVLERVDRWELPARMFDDPGVEAGLGQPGVITHLQVLRSHLWGRLLQRLPPLLTAALCALAIALVFVRRRPRTSAAVALVAVLGLLGLDLWAIREHRLMLPTATVAVAAMLAVALRAAADGIQGAVERNRLKRSFAGQFSPAVMEQMLDGGLAPGIEGRPAQACVLFSDLRGFTTLSERLPPEQIPILLRRYFDRMVEAVHRVDGTVIAFMGDGLMACFGAPNELADPCRAGLDCALEMQTALAGLNAEFEAEGLPRLAIGIGLNYGRVTSGNVGSSQRHNFSTIGDPVNVASRLEGLTKDLGRTVLVTRAVVDRVPEGFHFEPMGPQAVKGHTPVEVWALLGRADHQNAS
ncbi:MAG: hypothetical protein RL087_1862 [Pseudomonadota bacterium]